VINGAQGSFKKPKTNLHNAALTTEHQKKTVPKKKIRVKSPLYKGKKPSLPAVYFQGISASTQS